MRLCCNLCSFFDLWCWRLFCRESEPTQLRDFVTDENRIPLATLDDYVKVSHCLQLTAHSHKALIHIAVLLCLVMPPTVFQGGS